jgi:hypothetical protein
MSDEVKAVENSGGCGCGGTGGKCGCGGQKCCCRCIKKALCALVLLLLGGVIGYFMGMHCAYSRCHYGAMGCPMTNVVAVPVDAAPSKK